MGRQSLRIVDRTFAGIVKIQDGINRRVAVMDEVASALEIGLAKERIAIGLLFEQLPGGQDIGSGVVGAVRSTKRWAMPSRS
jgi:hypothetical protein